MNYFQPVNIEPNIGLKNVPHDDDEKIADACVHAFKLIANSGYLGLAARANKAMSLAYATQRV